MLCFAVLCCSWQCCVHRSSLPALLWRQGMVMVRRGACMSALRVWQSADRGQRTDGAAYIFSSVAYSCSLNLAHSLIIEPQNG